MDATMSIGRDEGGEIRYKIGQAHRGEPSADDDAIYSAAGEFFEAEPRSLAPANYTELTNTMGDGLGFGFRF